MRNNIHHSAYRGSTVHGSSQVCQPDHQTGALGLETDDMIVEGVDPVTLVFVPAQVQEELDVELLAELHDCYTSNQEVQL